VIAYEIDKERTARRQRLIQERRALGGEDEEEPKV
jgi:hypothetical protein